MKYSDFFDIVNQNLGYSCPPKNIIPSAGGCIHDSNVWEYEDGERFFVKYASTANGKSMLEAEIVALQLIVHAKKIKCPQPLFTEVIHSSGCVLVMEYLDLHRLDHDSGALLGHQLADLHRVKKTKFGLDQNNFIGATPQKNTHESEWVDFFWKHRIRYQLELASKNGYSFPDIQRLKRGIREALKTREVEPSLLHGDLWGGNAAALGDGTPVIFDPATYFGDPETDLAFTEVFGGFPRSFYAAYAENIELNSGYHHRKSIYNLYHYLNHLNLFGSGYLSSCDKIIQSLLN